MQSGGQYGLPDMQQFAVGRGPPHIFVHPQDLPAVSQHGHPLQHHRQSQQQIHHQHHLAQQHPQPPQHHQSQLQPQQQPQQQPLSLPHQQQKNQLSNQQTQYLELGPASDSPERTPPFALPPASSHFKPIITARDALVDDDGTAEEGERAAGCNRWPREETISLLRIRSQMDANFRDSGFKGLLWEEVSRKLAEVGYNRSAKKCKEKFENVHKYYKKTKDGRAGRQDGKSYRFFSELEALYATHNDNGGSGGGIGDGVGGASIAQGGIAQGYGGAVLPASGCCPTAAAASVQGPETSSGFQQSSDSSGDDDFDEPLEIDEQESRRKRKRRSWSSIKLFFENLAKQVIEQQEALHKKFLATIERRDQERLVREEAYKRQEIARLNKEHELRAQDHAIAATRDAALVAFLQKVTGQNLQLPRMPVPPTLSTPSDIQDDQEKELSDFNTRRWPKLEVHALIRLRSGMEPRFQEAGPKALLWEEISAAMSCMGYSRSAKRCKEKWENINKYFRKTKDSCRKRAENAKTCPYFHYLDTLYQKGILNSPNSKYSKIEGHSDNLLENSRAECGQTQDRNAEMLAIVPLGENDPVAATITTVQSCSSQENGPEGDHVSNKVKQKQCLPDASDNPAAPSALNFDGICGAESLSGSNTNRSLKMEGFVKEILELQQQQHQKLMEEYERMEQAREIREHQSRQQQQIHLSQERSQSNTARDNAALMALVHKLAGDSSGFTMPAPSSTE